MFFDFVQGGAEDEITLSANRAAFARWSFTPRVLNDVGSRDQTTTVLGQAVSSPIILAPVGLAGLVEPKQREKGAAEAAGNKGVVFALSSSASST